MTTAERTRLGPGIQRYLLAVSITRFGTGLTLPFTLILLHEVRGISLPTVGLLLAVPGVVGLLSVPVGGALIDRLGPRVVLTGCLLLQAAGLAGLALGSTPEQVLPALLLNGIGLGPSFPAGNALLAGLVDGPSQSARAYGVQFTVINAAIGVGTLVSAAVVDVHRASTFEGLFWSAALLCVAPLPLLPSGRTPVHEEGSDSPSYREVWADRLLRRMCVLWLLFAMTGYAALDSGLPAFARVVGHVQPSVIALAYTVNTVLIVALQLPVVRWLGHWRRTRALAVAAGLWALAWGVLGVSQSIVVVLVFAAVFGVGEVFQAPAMQPLLNAIATERLRGRYNALAGGMFSVAFVVSPALSAVLIGNGLGRLWIFGLCGGSVATIVVLARLRTALSDEQDGLSLVGPSRSVLEAE